MFKSSFYSYQDTAIEKMYLLNFGEDCPFPFKHTILSVRTNVKDFLIKKMKYTESFSSFFTKIESSNNKSENNDSENSEFPLSHFSHDESGHSIFLSKQNPKSLIRLCLTEKNYSFYIASESKEEVDLVVKTVSSKFAPELEDFEKKTFFGVLVKTESGIKIKSFPLKDGPWNKLDIESNYGKPFVDTDKLILSKLENSTGKILMLHGNPGCGKSFYIKHLSHKMGGKRKFIFIPSHYVDSLSSPDFLPLLLNNRNCVLVLEDSEVALLSRDKGNRNESLVSSLLNLGDGILSDLLGITIVVTFNTQKDKIDEAIVRKGRLLHEHEFKPLSKEDAQKLIDKLGKKYIAKSEMPLCEIYGLEDDTGHKKIEEVRKPIGFFND